MASPLGHHGECGSMTIHETTPDPVHGVTPSMKCGLMPASSIRRHTPVPAPAGFPRRRITFAIALMAMLAVLGLSSASLYGQSAKTDYKRGQSAEARQDYDTALADYEKAAKKKPEDLAYRSAVYRVRNSASLQHLAKGRKLLEAGNQQGALTEFLRAADIDPGNEAARQEIARIQQMQGGAPQPSESTLPEAPSESVELGAIAAPPMLKPLSNEPLTLHMTEDAKVIYQAVGKAAGINVLFDPDYNSKRIQVDLNNVSLLDALRILGTLSGTFWRPVTSNTIFVAQDTRMKRTELQEQAVQTFYLTNAWQQNDLNDVQTALRNVMPDAKVYGVASQNAIVMRGTPDQLLLAQQLIDDLDKARPEVVVDIAVLEVSKNWEQTLGIAWPNSIGITLQPPYNSSTAAAAAAAGQTTISPTLYNLAHANSNDFAVSIGTAQLNLLLTNTDTRVLQSPRIRALDGQKATMKIGSRIPIATGSYQTGAATAVVSSLVNTQFQYQDVGVTMEVTPTIHYDHDVTLKVNIAVTAQSGSVNISGVTEPILSQRTIDQTIRLSEGEVSILGGIQNTQEQQSWNGLPGLSAIPILKYLFGSKDHTQQDDDIVFVVIPHIVRSEQLNLANLRPIDTGSGQFIDLRHVAYQNSAASQSGIPASAGVPPVQASGAAQSAVGTVPSQGINTAATAALAEMRAQNRAAASPANLTPAAQAAVARAAGQAAAAGGGNLSFVLNAPTAPVAAGSTFQVPVMLNGGTDVASIPLQLKYDPAHLSLVNVSAGQLLGQDGQAVALVHRDDGPGDLTVVTSRPPGSKGVSGSGTVCVLSFQAKTPGSTVLTISRAAAVNSSQQESAATGSQVGIVVK